MNPIQPETGSAAGRSQARLAAQHAVLRVLTESASLNEATSRLLKVVCEGLGWEFGAVWRVGRRANVLHCVETWRLHPATLTDFDALTRNMTFEKGVGLPGRVWETGRPVWVEDVTRDANFPRAPVAAAEGLRGAFALPMRLSGELLGVIEFFSRRIEEPDEDLLRTMAGVGREVARLILRKRKEEELEQLFLMSRDLLCIAGFDGRFKRLNPAWSTTLGWTLEELMAVPYVDFVHPEDRERTAAEAGDIASGTETVEFVNRYRCKDGSYRWLAWSSAGAASRRAVFAVARDITETMRAAEELSRAKEAAEASSRAKSEFLALVSHEVRTPIGAVIGMTDLALGTRLNREQRDYLMAVKGSAETLLALINDLLDLSKMEAGKLVLDDVPFDLREAVAETVRMVSHRAHPKGLELICHVTPEVPEQVVGDPLRLRQVLYNLVGNAIKFTPQGEVVVRVEPDGTNADDGVALRFTVADTGIGIPPEKHQVIFEAFEQADRSTTRLFGGTGLGLSIAARLVERMGGAIAVHSEPDRGSTFSFTARFGRSGSPPRADSLRGVTALVVEGHAAHRAMLVETLAGWGAETTGASSADEASQRLGERAFGVVLVAAGAGEERVLESLRNDARHRMTRVILMTAPGPGVRLRRAGRGVRLLAKPIRPADLLEAVLAGLGRASARDWEWGRSSKRRGPALVVLVAEDNSVNQALIGRLLEQRGHHPEFVGTGPAALAALENGHYDVVLMDVRMPGMDGIEVVTRARRAEAPGRRVPIVALTADAMKGDRERCLAAGMDAYLTKPVEPARLFDLVERLAAGRPTASRVAAPAPAPAGAQAFDLTGALGWVGGDRDLLREVIQIFLTDAPAMLDRARAAVASGDPAQVHEAAHALKGAAAHLAASPTVEAARALERLGRDGDLTGAPAALESLEAEMDRLVRDLGQVLNPRP